MKHVVEGALLNMLENDVDVRYVRNDTHEHGDIGVSKYTLHYDLVLDFVE